MQVLVGFIQFLRVLVFAKNLFSLFILLLPQVSFAESISNGYLVANLANASSPQFYPIPVRTRICQKPLLAVYFVAHSLKF